MSTPALRPLAAECMLDLEPLAREDEQHDFALHHFVSALTAPLEDAYEWASEDEAGHAGMSALLDPDVCPAGVLPWLGQFRGVRVASGTPELLARAQVKDAAGFRRGRTSAIVTAARATLTDAQVVVVVERTTNAYHLTVRTRTSETPDPAATLAAMLAVKPGGVILTHVVSDEPIIDEFTRSIDSITAAIDSLTPADVT